MLERVVERATAIENVSSIIVATSTDIDDEPIVIEATRLGISSYRGHPTDVLDRYYHAATQYEADAVMRITADCPLLDPGVATQVIDQFLATGADYCSNIRPPSYPDGLDVELLSYDALATCWKDARLDSDREHVTTYIRRTRSELFKIANVVHPYDLSSIRWTVDENEDLEFMRALVPILDSQHGNSTDLSSVLQILRDHPEIGRLNSSINRNEGWKISLSED